MPHLSLRRRRDIGAGTNIGAGNITANYDGRQEAPHAIGARVARPARDYVFVAPVTIGDDA